MLKLINDERRKAGVPTLELGDNIAAQLHSENALANCFSSHWGLNGLKPYMRYSLVGGYQSNAENGSGSDYCIKAGEGFAPNLPTQMEIVQIMNGLMSSSGHRRNILNKWHKRVNIGLAWDEYNFQAYQHFEGDYVEYTQLPAIKNGQLSFSGKARNSVRFDSDMDLGVQIYFDPPPEQLTRGQVARTYCYDNGLRVAALRPPIGSNRRYLENTFTTTYATCPDPYKISKDTPAPASPDEATELWGEAYYGSKYQIEQAISGHWITASQWAASDTLFSVSANIQKVLAEHGDGVYTIVVWGKIDGENAVISQYSLFHGITPPDIRKPVRLAAQVPSPAATITPATVLEPTITTTYTVTLFPTPSNTPTSTSTPPPTAALTPTSTPTPIQVGSSRDNSLPLGQPGTTQDDLMVSVVEVQKDAHDIVVQANESKSYYQGPPAGHLYILVRIKVKNLSSNPRKFEKWDRMSVVGPSNLEFRQCHTPWGAGYYPHEVPEEYDDDQLMFHDGELEGNLCFTVKSSDLDSLVTFDKSESNWLFFALQ